MRYEAKRVGRMSGDAGALLESEVIRRRLPITPSSRCTAMGLGRAGIGLSSCNGLRMGRHVKAPVRCPCSQLATLHGAPRTHSVVVSDDAYNIYIYICTHIYIYLHIYRYRRVSNFARGLHDSIMLIRKKT